MLIPGYKQRNLKQPKYKDGQVSIHLRLQSGFINYVEPSYPRLPSSIHYENYDENTSTTGTDGRQHNQFAWLLVWRKFHLWMCSCLKHPTSSTEKYSELSEIWRLWLSKCVFARVRVCVCEPDNERCTTIMRRSFHLLLGKSFSQGLWSSAPPLPHPQHLELPQGVKRGWGQHPCHPDGHEGPLAEVLHGCLTFFMYEWGG